MPHDSELMLPRHQARKEEEGRTADVVRSGDRQSRHFQSIDMEGQVEVRKPREELVLRHAHSQCVRASHGDGQSPRQRACAFCGVHRAVAVRPPCSCHGDCGIRRNGIRAIHWHRPENVASKRITSDIPDLLAVGTAVAVGVVEVRVRAVEEFFDIGQPIAVWVRECVRDHGVGANANFVSV